MADTAVEPVVVLSRALDQTGDVLAAVHREDLSAPTPCAGWDVAHLIGHLVAAPRRFVEMVRGGEPDWSAEPQPVSDDWAAQFRIAADDLIHTWHQLGDAADPGAVDWQTAEFALHTWDLVRATGQQRPLDPEVARRGLAFMSEALTPENRGKAFGPEVEAPPGASDYDRLAALGGRSTG